MGLRAVCTYFFLTQTGWGSTLRVAQNTLSVLPMRVGTDERQPSLKLRYGKAKARKQNQPFMRKACSRLWIRSVRLVVRQELQTGLVPANFMEYPRSLSSVFCVLAGTKSSERRNTIAVGMLFGWLDITS